MEQNTDNTNTALLIMDVQNATANSLKDPSPVLKQLNKAIAKARAKKIPLIYVVVGFRKGYPELSPNNKASARLRSAAMNLDDEESFTVHESVAPQPGEIIVTKRRVSAFTGSDLEVILRGQGITKLVLTGLSTSGVVLSTLREAADKDYVITVLSDCCADADEEVHRVLITKVFPRQADVFTADEWCSIHSI